MEIANGGDGSPIASRRRRHCTSTVGDRALALIGKRELGKQARRAAIIAAAVQEFADHGFAGARVDEIARRAGVSRPTFYLYFEGKADIFGVAVREAMSPSLDAIKGMAEDLGGPFDRSAPLILARAMAAMRASRLPLMVRITAGAATQFPGLAALSQDVAALALDMITTLISKAQARGEVAGGDPRVHAYCLLGPLVMAILFRDTFSASPCGRIDLNALADQHAQTLLNGLLAPAEASSPLPDF